MDMAFFSELEYLWNSVIQCKYKYFNLLRIADLQVPKSGDSWRNICASLLNNAETKKISISRNKEKNWSWKKIHSFGMTRGLVNLP